MLRALCVALALAPALTRQTNGNPMATTPRRVFHKECSPWRCRQGEYSTNNTLLATDTPRQERQVDVEPDGASLQNVISGARHLWASLGASVESALVELGAAKRRGGPGDAPQAGQQPTGADSNEAAEAVEKQHEKEMLAQFGADDHTVVQPTNGSKFAWWFFLLWIVGASYVVAAIIATSIKALIYYFLCFRRQRVEDAKLEAKYADREGRQGSATIDDVDLFTCLNGSNGLRNLLEALCCWEYLFAETVTNLGYCGGNAAGWCLTGCTTFTFVFIATGCGVISFYMLLFSIQDSMMWLVWSIHIIVFGVSVWGVKIFIRTKMRGGRGTTTDVLKDACITCVPCVYQAGHFQEAEFVEVYGGKAKGDKEAEKAEENM